MITRENETVKISATDNVGVAISVSDSEADAMVEVTPDEARQLSVRLLQAADLADPLKSARYHGGGF